MSLYSVTVSNTSVGRAGTTNMIVIGFFPHINEARESIVEWVNENFVGPVNVNVDFISHENTIFTSDVKGYERIVAIQ